MEYQYRNFMVLVVRYNYVFVQFFISMRYFKSRRDSLRSRWGFEFDQDYKHLLTMNRQSWNRKSDVILAITGFRSRNRSTIVNFIIRSWSFRRRWISHRWVPSGKGFRRRWYFVSHHATFVLSRITECPSFLRIRMCTTIAKARSATSAYNAHPSRRWWTWIIGQSKSLTIRDWLKLPL